MTTNRDVPDLAQCNALAEALAAAMKTEKGTS